MHAGEMVARDERLRTAVCELPTRPETPFPVLCAKFKLTWRCNLRCRMCGIWYRYPQGGELPVGLVLDSLRALHARGLRKVHFSGGEVLLYEGFETVLGYGLELGLQVNMTTNGTLLDKEWAKRLIQKRVHRVTISIDSADRAEHDTIRGREGAWDLSMRAIRLLRDRRERKGRGPRIAVNTVLTRSNVKHVDKLHAVLREAGVDSWHLLPVDTEHKADRPSKAQWEALSGQWEQWFPLLARPPICWSGDRSSRKAAKGEFAGLFYSEHRCYAPWFNLFVDADGRVYSCCMGRTEMTPYGNLHERDVTSLLDSPHRHALQQSFAAGHQYAVCERCDDFLTENRDLEAIASNGVHAKGGA